MATASEMLISLEKKFWQSMVDDDTETALGLLAEPSLMVSAHGAMKFDHAGYRKMAEKGTYTVEKYNLSDVQVVFPNDNTAVLLYHVKQTLKPRAKGDSLTQEMNDTSTWVKNGDGWKCVMHTETPADKGKPS